MSVVYMVRLRYLRRVLALLTQASVVKGCGWHGGRNQQWQATRVFVNADEKWQFKNKFENIHNPGRYLHPQPADRQTDGNFRLTGELGPCNFEVVQVRNEAHRIQLGGLAVTLVTGRGVPGINAYDQVLDLEADGAPVVLQPMAPAGAPANKRLAQTWSLVRLYPPPSDPFSLLPRTPAPDNGVYKIINSKTGTVLDVADTVGNPVHGVASEGGNHHKWILTHYDGYFLLRHSSGHFLAPDVADGNLPQKGVALIENYQLGTETTLIDDLPKNGTALIGHPTRGKLFLVKKVPNTDLYKIFFAPTNDTLGGVRGLSVNLARADSRDGTVVRLQQTRTEETQTWRFVR
ncbi:hypothetical protein AX14_001271 [Amanita brunnescens Koide BX004]|nr:hypothetical protein AX14_001271 [Amanita brunnescens Koide BX004]